MPRSKSGKGGSELYNIIDRVTLAKAFQLAHSLYRFRKRDRQIALTIVSEALNGVQVRLIAQQEADRHSPQKPTKVRWNTQQWLQLLIYCKSEDFERQQESGNPTFLSHEDMIIRYIKHLILTTSRRNSFHICLGLSRLIYDYAASETMAIYDMVFQDPDGSTRKSDAYYRARKNMLLNELAKRFEPFARIEQGVRGEKRFQPDSESNRFAQLVVEYLTLFTPWDTTCKLPVHLDAWTTIHALQFNPSNQIHSLIHPTCFARITRALRLDDPESRLALPRFFLGKEESPTPPDDPSPSELNPDETSEIRNRIAEQRRARKKFVANSLSVLADGIERARLNLTDSSRVRFDIDDDVKLIEVKGHSEKGELLLAAHILSHEKSDGDEEYSIVLEGGQKISLRLLASDDTLVPANLAFEINYQETNVFRIIRLWLGHVKERLSEMPDRRNWRELPVLGFRLGVAVLTLTIAVLTLYFALRESPGERIAKYQPPPTSIDSGKIPVPDATSSAQTGPTVEVKPSTAPGAPEPSTAATRPTPGNTTREQTIRATKSLLNIQRIFVESLGDNPFSQDLRKALTERLQAGNRFAITTSPDEADTAISGSAQRSGRRQHERTGQWMEVAKVTLQLVNVSGDIIWTRTYRGTTGEVADRFISDLLAGIESEKRGVKIRE